MRLLRPFLLVAWIAIVPLLLGAARSSVISHLRLSSYADGRGGY